MILKQPVSLCCISVQPCRCGENMIDHRAMSRASEVRQQLKRYVARLEKGDDSSGASAAPDGNGIIRKQQGGSAAESSFQRYGGGHDLQGEPLRKTFVAVSTKYSVVTTYHLFNARRLV